MNPPGDWRMEQSIKKVSDDLSDITKQAEQADLAVVVFAARLREMQWMFEFDAPESIGASWKCSFN